MANVTATWSRVLACVFLGQAACLSALDSPRAVVDGGVDAATCEDIECGIETCFEGVCDGAQVVDIDDGCAVRRSGTVWCWGMNETGRAGKEPAESDVCVRDGDSVKCVYEPQLVDELPHDVTLVTTARHHGTCAVTASGEVWCFGLNDLGQLGHDPTEDGLCGSDRCSQPRRVDELASTTQVATTVHGTCALAGGEVYCWGMSRSGLLGLDPESSSTSFIPVHVEVPDTVVQITVGTSTTAQAPFACALTDRREVHCWGSNRRGTLGHDPTSDLDCADGPCNSEPTPVDLAEVDGIAVQIAASEDDVVCALTSTGHVACWGSGLHGHLGAGFLASWSFNPVEVELAGASGISVGESSMCAELEDEVQCWGENDLGQLGTGNLEGSTSCEGGTPCHVVPQSTLIPPGGKVVAAFLAGLALDPDGVVTAWGANGVASLAHEPATGADQPCSGEVCNPSPEPVRALDPR